MVDTKHFPVRPNWIGQSISGDTPSGDVVYAVETCAKLADALIEIAAAFTWQYRETWCFHCTEDMEVGCDENCPGLLARRALGVA